MSTILTINKNKVSKEVIPTIYKSHRSWCCTIYKDRSHFQNILKDLDLSDLQKEIIQIRYLSILENFQRRSRNYSYIFFSGHFIITVGSLFVPALLSIQNSDKSFTYTGDAFSIHIYWATFVISLLVTIFNGVLTLFKVDKKYYFLNTTLERLRTEGWQYFSLSGRYDGRLLKNDKPNDRPNHQNQFVYFTHFIEKIKMKQVEEEYYKADEKIGQAPNTASNGQANGNLTSTIGPELYPPSIDQALNSMNANMPEPVKRAVNSIIKSQTTIQQKPREENLIIESKQENRNGHIIIVEKQEDKDGKIIIVEKMPGFNEEDSISV
jgi:hypothetical protein